MKRAVSKYTVIYVLATILAVAGLILGSIELHFLAVAGTRAYDLTGEMAFELAMILALAVLMFVRMICQGRVPVRDSLCLNILFLAIILSMVVFCFVRAAVFLNVYEIAIFILGLLICSVVYDLYRLMIGKTDKTAKEKAGKE